MAEKTADMVAANKVYNKAEKRAIFEATANKTQYEVGLDFGCDRFFKTKKQIVNYVSKVATHVKNFPGFYGMSKEEVRTIMDKRKTRSKYVGEREQTDIEPSEASTAITTVSSLVQNSAKKAAKILDYKLGEISRSRKKMKELSFTDMKSLGTIFGILFDKSQILKGSATQNIAVHAKIDHNLSPDQLIDLIQKERENNYVEQSQK